MVVIKGMPQSRPTLCDPTDCSPTRLLCPWVSPGKNTRVGCHSLLQEILPTEIKPMFPASQADSLWSEPSEKPCEIWYSAATMWFKCYKSHKGLTYSEKSRIFFFKPNCKGDLESWVSSHATRVSEEKEILKYFCNDKDEGTLWTSCKGDLVKTPQATRWEAGKPGPPASVYK